MGKIKVLELTNFSAGICGVFARVKEESTLLSGLGYEVQIFSSNATKGSKEIAKAHETIGMVKVQRFPYLKLGGESFMYWNCFRQAVEYAPDIIIAHVYRHKHTTLALKIRKKLNSLGKKCIVFLVTHAPFNDDNSERGILSTFAVKFYDYFIGKRTINKFDKVITISNWEVPYLLDIGLKNKNLFHLPNGIPSSFFKAKFKVGQNKLLFLGRISPVKNLELVISALKGTNISLEIVGPFEVSYKRKLANLIKKENIRNITFSKPIYNIEGKINKINSSRFFILPSKREGMPQSLIEAMSLGRVCIGSDVEGIKDLINHKVDGFTFKSDNLYSIKEVINYVVCLDNKKLQNISKNASNFAFQFNWNLIISKLDKLIKSELHKMQ